MSYMNRVRGLVCHESPVAKWLQHPTGVRNAIGSIYYSFNSRALNEPLLSRDDFE